MKITFEVNDEILPSIEQYLSSQVQAVNDPVTKAQRLVRLFDNPEAWIQTQVGNLLHQCVMQYPTDAIREKLAAANALHEQVKASVIPTPVKA